MYKLIENWYQPSVLLFDAQLTSWLSDAEVLEHDCFGIKVVKLASGDILKIFRVKRTLSSAHIFSYARSFCRNAKRLKQLGIPTIAVKQLFHLEDAKKSAVLYAPLMGLTVKELYTQKQLTSQYAYKLGTFIAKIHDAGIYFRGLHSGNIVLTSEGEYGLIDISEMTIFSWRLDRARRLKNFARFWRDPAEPAAFGIDHTHQMISAYCRHSLTVKFMRNDIISLWQAV